MKHALTALLLICLPHATLADTNGANALVNLDMKPVAADQMCGSIHIKQIVKMVLSRNKQERDEAANQVKDCEVLPRHMAWDVVALRKGWAELEPQLEKLSQPQQANESDNEAAARQRYRTTLENLYLQRAKDKILSWQEKSE